VYIAEATQKEAKKFIDHIHILQEGSPVPVRWVVFILGAMQEEGDTSGLLERLRKMRIWPLVCGRVARMMDGAVYEITDDGM
jgi:hypothetical protein